MDPKTLLKSAKSILVIDWPSRDVPEALARAGFDVVVRGGPGPTDFSRYKVSGDKVITEKAGRAPERVDVVYCHRPMSELGEIVATAKSLHAKAIWMQSGLSAEGVKDPKGCWMAEDQSLAARKIVESSGLMLVAEPYIADLARNLSR